MRPWNSGQPFGRYGIAARGTDAEVSRGQPIQRSIDLPERLIVQSLNLERDELVMENRRLVVFRHSSQLGEAWRVIATLRDQLGPLCK